MATIQIRDISKELHRRLKMLAEREHRSLSQQAVVLLEQGLNNAIQQTSRRKTLLQKITATSALTWPDTLPGPAALIRQDRDKR